MIGILLLTASFVIPRLEGYQSSGYEFLSRGSFVLIDAAIFIPGLLFVILGNIIMEGFSMQKEMDEIMKEGGRWLLFCDWTVLWQTERFP